MSWVPDEDHMTLVKNIVTKGRYFVMFVNSLKILLFGRTCASRFVYIWTKVPLYISSDYILTWFSKPGIIDRDWNSMPIFEGMLLLLPFHSALRNLIFRPLHESLSEKIKIFEYRCLCKNFYSNLQSTFTKSVFP